MLACHCQAKPWEKCRFKILVVDKTILIWSNCLHEGGLDNCLQLYKTVWVIPPCGRFKGFFGLVRILFLKSSLFIPKNVTFFNERPCLFIPAEVYKMVTVSFHHQEWLAPKGDSVLCLFTEVIPCCTGGWQLNGRPSLWVSGLQSGASIMCLTSIIFVSEFQYLLISTCMTSLLFSGFSDLILFYFILFYFLFYLALPGFWQGYCNSISQLLRSCKGQTTTPGTTLYE